MPEGLRLLTVHAHPDDESSKGASTIARYHAEGVHTVLVTCTGGEEGDILNPAMDLPGVRERIAEIRRRELEAAVNIIGFDELVWLGYRDSGMPGQPSNEHPDSFASAPLEEAVGRLVAVLRRVRPQVVISYPPDERGYRHPDHLRVNEVTVAAFDAAGDEKAYPEAGEPYQPLKLYYSAFSRGSMLERHEKFLELGLESPYAERIAKGDLPRDAPAPDLGPQARISIEGFQHVRRDALLAHATQIDPNSKGWFGLPEEVEFTLHPHDVFVLAKSLVHSNDDEDDLFAGIRDAEGH